MAKLRGMGRVGLLLGSLSCLAGGGVAAQSALAISRAVYVENRAESGARAITPAGQLRRGDRVVLLVEWDSASPGLEQTARGARVESAIPRHLAFRGSSRDSFEISADGGLSWGRLGTMRLRQGNGTRLASPEDATHVRWTLPRTMLAQGRGRIAYSAVVR